MSYTLLAHRCDGTEAIVQLENGHPYSYRFGYDVDTYSLITDLQHKVGRGWEHNYDGTKQFFTIADLKEYVVKQGVVVHE